MKSKTYSIPKKTTHESGFALIATISLMVLLLVLALGMLSLSSVELRNSGNKSDLQAAKENARMAMMLALGELQKNVGSDTRITAPANALAGNSGASAYVTGAWRSWEGFDHDTTSGVPQAPTYSIKNDFYDKDSPDDGRFLGWLVSGPEQDNDAENPPDLDETSETVPLVAEGTLGTSSNKEVHLFPTKINGDDSYAWWIQGENQKALMKEAPDEPTSAVEWSERLTSYGRPNTEDLGFTDDSELAKAVSRQSLNLATNSLFPSTADPELYVANAHFHDVTANSRGLLTNAATGGWRKDLSLMTEYYSDITDKNFFKLSPDSELSYNNDELMYHWAAENGFLNEASNALESGASTTWTALADHALKYKDATVTPDTGAASMASLASGGRDAINLRPVLARLQWIYYFAATQDGTNYTAQMKLQMIATYWNPYNVTIPSWTGQFWLRDKPASPNTFEIKVGSSITNTDDIAGITYGTNNQVVGNNLVYMFTDTEEWSPGETRMYSSGSVNGNGRALMSKGFDPTGGYTFDLRDNAGVKMDSRPGSQQMSVDLELPDPVSLTFVQYRVADMTGASTKYSFSKATAEKMWQSAIDKVEADYGDGIGPTLSEAATQPIPFLTTITEFKTVPPQDNSVVDNTNIMIGRGYSNNNPLLARFSSTTYDSAGTRTDIGEHPESLPLDFQMIPMDGGTNDVSIPEGGLDPAEPFAYIGTGKGSNDGLSRLTIAEIPTKALQSIGELQHFPINFYNPSPPYITNAIGNSNASYLIETDEISIGGHTSSAQTSYDHSYLGNHLLFDDWFVSSITTGTEHDDFLNGTLAPNNEMYIPASDAATAATFDSETSWYDIASKMEVDGMFNVNSTSAEAWKALLKNLKGAMVPMNVTDPAQNALDAGSDSPAPRTSVAGAIDPEQVNGTIAKLSSYTRMTDEQIDALADQIVEQIKLRGPFLSLSEFVNRQLSSDTDLAVAGAVEAALAELSERDDDTNPHKSIKDIFSVTPNASALDGFAGHVFTEAADGNPIYGYPAWIRQADILRSIAPVLSVRDDTFCIRAYGESNGVEAWCEAIVQRKANYIDPVDSSAPLLGGTLLPTSLINQEFGRKFEIVSFRWLNPDEV